MDQDLYSASLVSILIVFNQGQNSSLHLQKTDYQHQLTLPKGVKN